MFDKMISDLKPAGLELFAGMENLLHELAEEDELAITGGQRRNSSTSNRGSRRRVVRRRRPRVIRGRRNVSTD